MAQTRACVCICFPSILIMGLEIERGDAGRPTQDASSVKQLKEVVVGDTLNGTGGILT